MQITIKARIMKQLHSDLAEVGILRHIEWDPDGGKRGRGQQVENDVDVDLSKLTRSEVEKLRNVLRDCTVLGTKVLAADLDKYLKAEQEGLDGMQARNCRQAAWILEHMIAHMEHHLVFAADAHEGSSYVGYMIDDVRYLPERGTRGSQDFKREHVAIDLNWIDLDARKSSTLVLYPEEVIGRTAVEILREQGYLVETPTLIANLKVETERYYAMRDAVGVQYLARGTGVDDLDDSSAKHLIYVSGGRNKRVRMDLGGVATRVLVDSLSETGNRDHIRDSGSVSLYRWHKMNLRYFSPSEDDLARHLEADEDTDFAPQVQLPVHPLVPVFDLKRHARLRVHLNNLTLYEYKREIIKHLVIPARDLAMIELLVDQSTNSFADIIGGKGQSMNVLSGGPPGTGKTLCCEVFAEFKGRPLYSVQCSQLGLQPDDIEKNLGIILSRANRWNAILLLDEADVYISRRGSDLQHNAIVGVFLRVLEYSQCILFMTTNLPDQVDDAIASRCIVAVRYDVPSPTDQAKIWRQLADLNGIPILENEITRFVERHPRVSGRDVKNLLKLASFVAARDKTPVDCDALEFALAYKPTADIDAVQGSTS